MAVPSSRLFLGIIPWYSLLIVCGAALAIFLAVREEPRTALKKDTVIDFALWVLPCGIIGARVYYVIFAWDQFKSDFWSVFKIWEGGIAIYGAVIAGLLTAVFFCRSRKLPLLQLCDIIAPGLVLAQAIGRWGNYFNQEAFGLPVTNPALCFFPFAVLIPGSSGLEWHMATFFYESLWNFLVFVFLLIGRRKWFRYAGDVFFFYAFLYACGRLIIEDFRLDSLYASSSLRISQLLSLMICMGLMIYYLVRFRSTPLPFVWRIPAFVSLAVSLLLCPFVLGLVSFPDYPLHFLLLLVCSLFNILGICSLYGKCAEGDVLYADIKG